MAVKLEEPKSISINFKPSPKQLVVWRALMPECPKCGGKVEQIEYAKDVNGNALYKPKCTKCGNSNIPQTILCGGAAGGGKCLSISTLVCTPFGFRHLKDLKVGDIITNPNNGGQQRIIYIHPKGKFNFYRIEFCDGTSVECSEGHLWKCHVTSKRTKRKNPDNTMAFDRIWETTEMYEWFKAHDGKKNKLTIPLCAPVQFTCPRRDKLIHPYIVGALIGDGCLVNNVIQLTTMDEYVVKRFEELGYDMSNYSSSPFKQSLDYFIRDKELAQSLDKIGLLGKTAIDKHIPKSYKYGTIEERKQLMQGLMDTDGYVDIRGHMSYTTISKQLAEDVAFVVRSLGGKATITRGKAGYKDKSGNFVRCNDAYDVTFITKIDPELVSLPRKKSRAKYEYNGGVSELCKRITNITPIGKQESFCISVSDPSGLYVTDDFTVTHNSYLASCWLIYMCIRYEGVRMFVARTTLKSIRNSTWKTIFDVLRDWGFVQDKHFKENVIFGYIEFWNGSTIEMVELAPSNVDPEYQRLGSAEYTGGYIEEAGEVDEKGAEVLISRIRYKVQETTVTQKCLLGSNPSLNWIKKRFVYDDEGNEVQCAEGDMFVPFTVYDNPNESFRMQYIQNLMRIKDIALRERLLNGNWLWVDTNMAAAYWAFDGSVHLGLNVKEQFYDPLKPVVLSFDFNVLPYMSCLVLQFDYSAKMVYVLEEILGLPTDKTNNTPAFSKKIARKYLTEGHLGGISVTGDPAGLARSTQTLDNVNNYSILMDELSAPQLHASKKLLATQPPLIQRLEFVNSVLEGKIDGWSVLIDMRCNKFKEDLIYQRKNQDGTKEKKRVEDTKLKLKYEKYGHLSDCFDYALCYFLSDLFTKFKRGRTTTSVTTVSPSTISDTFDW